MVKFKLGDLLKEKNAIICQQVNCRGKMRRGLAKQVSEQFPEVNEKYINLCNFHETAPQELLGVVQFVNCGKREIICNMFAQDDYRFARSRQNTDYAAFQKCLDNIVKIIKDFDNLGTEKCRIAFPWKIGSDLGGADFKIIFEMIVTTLKDYELTFCYLETPEDLKDYMKVLDEISIHYCKL